MNLDQFETLVQTQKPASMPWAPVTDYSFEARKAIESIHPQLIKDVFQPGRVLDAGCGYGYLVKMLNDLDVEAWGFDSVSRNWEENCFRGELTEDRPDEVSAHLDTQCADLVVCREVLEHLTILDVRKAVRSLCALSHRYVYVTTRFHPIPCGLLDVATSDDLDPTHISMCNKEFIRLLFVLEGFTRRKDLEERMDWQHKGRCLVYERAA